MHACVCVHSGRPAAACAVAMYAWRVGGAPPWWQGRASEPCGSGACWFTHRHEGCATGQAPVLDVEPPAALHGFIGGRLWRARRACEHGATRPSEAAQRCALACHDMPCCCMRCGARACASLSTSCSRPTASTLPRATSTARASARGACMQRAACSVQHAACNAAQNMQPAHFCSVACARRTGSEGAACVQRSAFLMARAPLRTCWSAVQTSPPLHTVMLCVCMVTPGCPSGTRASPPWPRKPCTSAPLCMRHAQRPAQLHPARLVALMQHAGRQATPSDARAPAGTWHVRVASTAGGPRGARPPVPGPPAGGCSVWGACLGVAPMGTGGLVRACSVHSEALGGCKSLPVPILLAAPSPAWPPFLHEVPAHEVGAGGEAAVLGQRWARRRTRRPLPLLRAPPPPSHACRRTWSCSARMCCAGPT